MLTVSSHVIVRRILPAIDSDGGALDEIEDLPARAGVKRKSWRSAVRALTVSPRRASLATSTVVGFGTPVLGDSAKWPRYATATTAASPSIQSVRRNSPLIEDRAIVRLDEMLLQGFGARERSFRFELPI
ncbi:MAG: hypothetical protein ABSB70_00010 [Candidatus Velthaea sp.]